MPMEKEQWRRLVAAVGFAARRLWRRPGKLESGEQVVLDLLAEALARMGLMVGPVGSQAVAEIASAPTAVRELVHCLLLVAKSGHSTLRASAPVFVLGRAWAGQQGPDSGVGECASAPKEVQCEDHSTLRRDGGGMLAPRVEGPDR